MCVQWERMGFEFSQTFIPKTTLKWYSAIQNGFCGTYKNVYTLLIIRFLKIPPNNNVPTRVFDECSLDARPVNAVANFLQNF